MNLKTYIALSAKAAINLKKQVTKEFLLEYLIKYVNEYDKVITLDHTTKLTKSNPSGSKCTILFVNDFGRIAYRGSYRVSGNKFVDNYDMNVDKDKTVFINGTLSASEVKNLLTKEINRCVSDPRGYVSLHYIEQPGGESKQPIIDTRNTTDTIREFVGGIEIADNATTGKIKIKEKENTMKNRTINKMLEINKATAVHSAKVQLGKTANKLIVSKVKPQLPRYVRGYADSPLAELVVGNIVAGLLIQFAPNDKRAEIVSEAMIAAGTQVAIESFNIPEMLNELLDSVDISTLTNEVEAE